MSRRQRLIALIGLTVSALFLWLAFNEMNPGEVWGYLRAANPVLIIFAAFWYFLAVFVISTRWRFLLRPAWSGDSPSIPTPIPPLVTATPSSNESFTPAHDVLSESAPAVEVSITPSIETPSIETAAESPDDPVIIESVPIESTPVIDVPPAPPLPPPQPVTIKAPTIPQLAGLVSVGYMGNNVFPLRAGEILRIALVQHDFDIPFARVTTTVLVERILDGIVMLTFILAALVFGGFPMAESVRPVALFAAPLFIIALLVFFYFALNPTQLHAFSARILARLPDRFEARVLHVIDDAIDGLEALRTPRDLLGAIAFSYGSWMLEASTYLIVAKAFNLPVDYWAMLLLVGVVNLAGLIPASPGQFGVYEFFAIAVLTAIGLAESAALAYAFSVHLVIWLPVTLVGFYILWRRSLGFNIFRSAQRLESAIQRKSAPDQESVTT